MKSSVCNLHTACAVAAGGLLATSLHVDAHTPLRTHPSLPPPASQAKVQRLLATWQAEGVLEPGALAACFQVVPGSSDLAAGSMPGGTASHSASMASLGAAAGHQVGGWDGTTQATACMKERAQTTTTSSRLHG
jgi:hypothetical protein